MRRRPEAAKAETGFRRARAPILAEAKLAEDEGTVEPEPTLGRSQADSTASHVTGGFRLEVLEGAGHWLQFERPDEVGRSLVAALSK